MTNWKNCAQRHVEDTSSFCVLLHGESGFLVQKSIKNMTLLPRTFARALFLHYYASLSIINWLIRDLNNGSIWESKLDLNRHLKLFAKTTFLSNNNVAPKNHQALLPIRATLIYIVHRVPSKAHVIQPLVPIFRKKHNGRVSHSRDHMCALFRNDNLCSLGEW